MGIYKHTVDAKGRMAFPNKLRDALGSHFIVTIGLEGCLYVYSEEEWEVFTDKLKSLGGSLAKAAKKKYAANAVFAETDSQGRILLSQNLREHADLGHDVIVIGNINRAEIWNPERWDKFNEEYSDEELAAALEDIDI
ncbi:MAG: division/cell wall cluster transcriptional repressor MraZ [Oscillospiraceae bacterium]|nr:division/cell wall cluster transcriptional repressor MraZ [Oscillospiraceae bacterium]